MAEEQAATIFDAALAACEDVNYTEKENLTKVVVNPDVDNPLATSS